ncbi:MAG: DUF3473 domain-containing protein [bacterium]|nr:DUF3473 domain-containing protein [bacterium]
MINALTVDVEDNHRIVARNMLGLEGPPEDAVVGNTHRLLELFRAHAVRGTFFVLGEIAAKFPELVRAIADEDHEIGVHGFYHMEVHRISAERFRREIGDAKALLEDLSGKAVRGHRAPSFSITPATRWALDILADLGLHYDSSIFPFKGRRYGWPGFPRDSHRMVLSEGRSIIEAPLSTVQVWGRRIPACGGGYLRYFPHWYTDWAIRHVQRERPAIVYMHPYDIDTRPPPAWLNDALRAGGNPARFYRTHQQWWRRTVESKLRRLLTRYQFAPLGEVIDRVLAADSEAGGS